MTRNVTTTFRRSAEASLSDEVFLCFLTISHPTLADPIRVVWDTIDYAFSGNNFIGFPFEITILSDDENPPTAKLTIQNVDPRIGDVIRELNSPPRIKIELISTADFSWPLLAHFDGVDGSTTFLNSGGEDAPPLTAFGNAQIDNAQSVFGGRSLLLDGVGSFANVSSASALAFGTDDFTISLRFRVPVYGEYVLYDSGQGQLQIRLLPLPSDLNILDENNLQILDENNMPISQETTPTIGVYLGGVNLIADGTPILTDTWYHVEVTRAAGMLRLFVNGIENSLLYPDVTTYIDNSPHIGASYAPDKFTNGWIEEVRAVGHAYHIANFTVPTSPYIPNYSASPTIIYSADKLFLINVSVDIIQVTGNIVGWDYLQRVWPGQRAMKANFPGLFR